MSELKVGFIGLGIMGKPMSKNLVRAGFPVTVYNRSKPAVEELVAFGAKAAGSCREVAEQSDVVITIVSDTPDVLQVMTGSGGVLEGTREGLICADMSTISPKATRELAEEAARRGVETLDAPVSGGEKGAIEGTLSIMVGGEQAAFEKCLPVFQAMGKKIVRIGGHGDGQTCKLCNQIVGALNMLGLAEALVFGQKSGIDLEKMLEVVGGGAAASWAVQNLGPKVIKRDFEPGFMVTLQQKDMRLVLGAAEEIKLPTLASGLVHQLWKQNEADDQGRKGIQALVLALEKLTGVTVGE
ncbi:MAG: NAD(P)-dependent oxidoreductase [Armatimonadetes bacterium]|nr:NAD(P)-dependent oxidoreductase [Armatimonadota bacterium]